MEEACGLFSPPAENFELFYEKSLDTKVLLAWSRETVVLAFRGTASLANLVADLQVGSSALHSRSGKPNTLSPKP